MGRHVALAALIFVTMLSHVAQAADSGDKLSIKLADRPRVSLSRRPPLTDAQILHIKELIASLANLDKPDFGLSGTLSGTRFAPIPDQDHATAFIMVADHHLGESTALKELVSLGPDALPYLLDALDNKTPTKVVIRHDFGFGAMWFARELQVNLVNPAETDVDDGRAEEMRAENHVEAYTIKIGDVCFVAIGQIVGRAYQAVRYQPTACIVLNSPTNDWTFRARVRGIWKSNDPRRKLFDSLCTDYATVGIHNGKSLDGWDYGNGFQSEAALRMLYYFPKETEALLASRLEKLDVRKDAKLDDYMLRCVANEVRSEDFIKAVAWSSSPPIRAALTGIFKRAEDIKSFMAALPAVDDKVLIRQRLEIQLNALPADDSGPFGDGNHLLTAFLQYTPDTARPMFDRYLQNPGVHRCHTVCVALRGARVTWDVAVLFPLLSDVRTFGWNYAIVPGQNEPRLPIRICDEAAVTLSENHPMFKFVQAGQYAEMDRQIAVIRATLLSNKAP